MSFTWGKEEEEVEGGRKAEAVPREAQLDASQLLAQKILSLQDQVLLQPRRRRFKVLRPGLLQMQCWS